MENKPLKVEEQEGLRPGHYACPGCGMAIAMRLVLKAIGKATVVSIPGCNAVIGNVYPYSAFNLPAFHSAFEIAAPTAAGIARGLKLRGIEDIPVLAFAGDGGTFDIGLQSLSGAADRNEDIIYVCLDNEAYMNTGIQSSSATPPFAWTITTPEGRMGHKKDIMRIMIGHKIPYMATASIGFPEDLMRKVKRAKALKGTKFIYVLTPCPTGWRVLESLTVKLSLLAVHSMVLPLYEIVEGKGLLTVKPKGIPVREYLTLQGRYAHLTEDQIQEIQREVEENWQSLMKVMGGGS
mgnify:CR=1 FL=1